MEIDDERLADMLAEEEGLSQLKAEVDEAIARHMAALERRFDEAAGGRDARTSSGEEGKAPDDLEGALRENLFWQEEIEKRIRESADARLAHMLIRQEQRAARTPPRKASRAAGLGERERETLELARVEREFEDAMGERREEQDFALAKRLEAEEAFAARAADGPASPKLRLASRLIRRFRRRAAQENAGK